VAVPPAAAHSEPDRTGSSNGGLAAFALILAQPDRFATLLGAPGAFDVSDPSTVDPRFWVDALLGQAVFNGGGELDVFWQSEVEAINEALTAAGIESQYVEFPGRGHSFRNGFDASVFFDFWLAH
jgi:enterochelin esterase-like enzyme